MRIALYGLILATLLGAASAAQAAAQSDQEGPQYLALGDSLAVGVGASDPASKGYVPLLFGYLQEDARWAGRGLTLNNLAISGETSTSMVTGGQLEKATIVLAARNQDNDPNNDVEVITIDIGGNDLLEHLSPGEPCFIDVQSPQCQAITTEVFATFSNNLAVILATLRSAAGPDTIIIISTYYNPFSGTGIALDEAANGPLIRFNGIIETVAASPDVNAQVADVFTHFDGKGPQLTHILEGDVHPNDWGYDTMTEAFIEALSLVEEPRPIPSPAPAATPAEVPEAGGPPAASGSSLAWYYLLIAGGALALLVGGKAAIKAQRER